MKSPIVATLITKEGFNKSFPVNELKDVMIVAKKSEVEGTASHNKMEFVLESHREVIQKNGKPHIVATYRER
jgi:hypothetical protein